MSIPPRSFSLTELTQRIREEYREMPSLRLTPSQAQRLFGLEPSVCATILAALVEEKFLSRRIDGQFVRSATTDLGHL